MRLWQVRRDKCLRKCNPLEWRAMAIDTTTEIQEGLEDLSLQILLGDPADAPTEKWTASLLNLVSLASSAGRPDLASIAETALKGTDKAGFAGDIEKAIEGIREKIQGQAAASTYSIAEDPELIGDFVMEVREHLESIESQLLRLEHDAGDMEAIHSIFRSFHSIKGLAGFLELPRIQEIAHEVETVLSLARQGDLVIDSVAVDVILSCKDYFAQWVRHLAVVPTSALPETLNSNRTLLDRVRLLSDRAEAAQPALLSTLPEPDASSRQAMRSVKVDTGKLDYLVDMVGEMVIAQSLVHHDPDLVKAQTPGLFRHLSQLSRITDEVQRTAMSMRMVPIGPLFQKMARLVRDLNRTLGKQASYRTTGDDVQLDRHIVEELADPLMHMVRNSIDHGIETPQQRIAAGKAATAFIELRAFYRSGHIVIEIVDDGRGIDREKVLEKALKIGLPGVNPNCTDAECWNLIFHPGFSTADRISNVSGRGVGMDVVKRQIQKLRGTVEIISMKGQGTTFSLKLPLTLAIIDGLVVGVGAERYILPLGSVRKMLRPTASMVSTIENRAEMVTIRDKLLPLVRLHKLFRIQPKSDDPCHCVFVIVEYGDVSFALMVDTLVGKQEVVIKGLGRTFQHVEGISGGAILGDGRVGLILDVQGLMEAHQNG